MTVVHPILREPKRVVATVVHLDDGAGATLADLFEAIGWDAEAATRMVVEVPFRRSRDAPSLVDGGAGSDRLLRALDITEGLLGDGQAEGVTSVGRARGERATGRTPSGQPRFAS